MKSVLKLTNGDSLNRRRFPLKSEHIEIRCKKFKVGNNTGLAITRICEGVVETLLKIPRLKSLNTVVNVWQTVAALFRSRLNLWLNLERLKLLPQYPGICDSHVFSPKLRWGSVRKWMVIKRVLLHEAFKLRKSLKNWNVLTLFGISFGHKFVEYWCKQ